MSKTQLKVAVMVDGTFFLKRYRNIYGKDKSPKDVIAEFNKIIHRHVKDEILIRIFYYDCWPSSLKIHTLISKKFIDFSQTEEAKFRRAFYDELKRTRKVALRMGELYNRKRWLLDYEKLKALLHRKIEISDLEDDDFLYDFKQKGIDIKLGVDISSLSYKRLVDRIVLIAGDSDFIPAIKMACIEGIDIILDPMWNPIDEDLYEHIDGLMSTCNKPKKLLSGKS